MQDALQVFDDLTTIDGQPMTTSRKVAARFKKAHKTVLRSIKRIEAAQPEFSRLNFVPRDYVDERGKSQPEYLMTRDGFALLAMGFTGDAAMSWKIVYINAFNRMAEEIAKAAHVPSITGTLYQQALTAEKAEALSFQAASDAAKIMRARKDVKPVLVQQVEMMREAVQLCLVLGLTKLPEIS
jgi:Rha family phage regulatory protein